jgi:hypothetical protein
MAGNYPDAPANRMEYDRDGTIVATVTSAGVITALTNTQARALNDEDPANANSFGVSTGNWVAFVFPELRDVSYIFQQWASTIVVGQAFYSTNTTNGFDGTWTSFLAAQNWSATTQPNYRSNAVAATATSVRGIRILSTATNYSVYTIHIYGKVSAATPDKLELWHPTLDEPLYQTPAALDYGDKGRGTSTDLSFRIKNLSATLTANTITVSTEALTDAASPTMESGMTLNYNGGAFAATTSLASLAPNTISAGLFVLRNAIPSTVTPGLWSQRVIASASTWT